KDCGVKPTADFETYFIDYDSAIIAWPYDYRGLDLVANDKKSLQEYYHSFNDWILDYDRAKIDDTFK
ncbi:MAG: DUF3885 domain-containing protein, partial [Alphaproteobacteria bacterium]|nr:DUF3885 domain-containing protein [Alphaproteobacteria bacterium]